MYCIFVNATWPRLADSKRRGFLVACPEIVGELRFPWIVLGRPPGPGFENQRSTISQSAVGK